MSISTVDPGSPGPLIIIGGRFEHDNTTILDEIKRLAAGVVGILATASEVADEVGPQVVNRFQEYGIDARLIPLSWDRREQSAFDPDIVDLFAQVDGVYFTGGDQRRIMQTLVQNSVETPVLEALRKLHGGGGLVAGSSAGAAVMSDPIIMGGTSLNALTRGIVADRRNPGLELGAGLGFFPWGIVDQHFIRRGRVGRLVVALQAGGRRYGFGIDENTALVVEGDTARVIGETGVVLIDAGDADSGAHSGKIDDVWISYADRADSIVLDEFKIRPHESKKTIGLSSRSFREAAPAGTNAFGAYAMHDLLFRLVQGDPAHYSVQRAAAFDRITRTRVTVELERAADRSRALVARAKKDLRFTAIDFRLRFALDTLPLASRESAFTSDTKTSTDSRLLLLGSSPLAWTDDMNSEWVRGLPQPIGIVAAASADSSRVAREYSRWLAKFDVSSETLDLRRANAEQRNRDEKFLTRLADMQTLIFPGGNQRRLIGTLRRRGSATRILRLIQKRYSEGLTLVGIGGAAAAFGTRMIAEGSSRAALLHGSSEDAGHHGMVIEEGLGFFHTGVIDQNFVRRHRLGRLIVACAEENFDLGIGLSETGGIELGEPQRDIRVFGGDGVYLATVDQEKLHLDDQIFSAQDVALHHILPGQHFDLETGEIQTRGIEDVNQTALDDLVSGLLRTCDAKNPRQPEADDDWLRLALTPGTPALLNIHSHRVSDEIG